MNQEQLNGYALIELTTHEGETFTLPSYIDTHGTRRYVVNRVIDVMWDNGLIDLNNLTILLERAPQAVPYQCVLPRIEGGRKPSLILLLKEITNIYHRVDIYT